MRALVVVYYWPPSGGPGVQRGVKLVAGLREHGIEPVVVTVDPATYALPGEYAQDPTLAAEVPPDVRVLHVPPGTKRSLEEALSALRVHRLAQHVAPGRFFERQAAWLRPLTTALEDEIARSRPDVVLTSSQPYVVHLAGLAVRRATGVPWVADFRDPWTLSWGRTWPSERALRWEERCEEDVLREASVVVLNTPGTRRETLARHPWLEPAKVSVVRNGYDPEDFRVPPADRTDGSRIRIVHSGGFRARPPGAERTGLRARLDRRGPEPVPYDLTTHSPEPLFRALAALGPDASRFEVRLVGSVDARWVTAAAAIGAASRVECAGYRPHRAAAAELLAADLLWLPTITRRDGGSVSNVPAKTYEYLGSGRPVLALAGPGDVADLLAGRERCVTVPAGPVATERLTGVLRDAVAGSLPPALPPDPPDAWPFRRSETARAMAEALRAAAAGASPAPLDPAPRGTEDAARP